MSYSLSSSAESSKVLYVNSRDADTYIEDNNFGRKMTTNFLYSLTEKLNVSNNQMALLSLYSATIPHSFFNVRSGVNDVIPLRVVYQTFAPVITDPPIITSKQYYLQLDDGNYGTAELIEAVKGGRTGFESDLYFGVKDLLLPSGTDGTGAGWTNLPITDVIDFDMTFNKVNNCFRFDIDYIAQNKVMGIALDFTWFSAPASVLPSGLYFEGGYDITKNADNMANALLGFKGDIDYPYLPQQVFPPAQDPPRGTPVITMAFQFFSVGMNGFYASLGAGQGVFDPTLSCQLQSQQVIDLNDNIHGLMLRTNLVSKGCMSSNTAVFSNILARIPITSIDGTRGSDGGEGTQGGMIYFNPSNATHQNLVDLNSIDVLGVRLTDDKDRTIDLNGLDFQIAILIQFVDAPANVVVPLRPLANLPQPIKTLVKKDPKNKPIKNKSSKKNTSK